MLFVTDFLGIGEWIPIDIVEDITGLSREEVISSCETVEITDKEFQQYEPSEADIEKHWLYEAEWAD